MIDVLVSGAAGRMGSAVVGAVGAETDMRVAMVVDPVLANEPAGFTDVRSALAAGTPDVMVDFTVPESVFANAAAAPAPPTRSSPPTSPWARC